MKIGRHNTVSRCSRPNRRTQCSWPQKPSPNPSPDEWVRKLKDKFPVGSRVFFKKHWGLRHGTAGKHDKIKTVHQIVRVDPIFIQIYFKVGSRNGSPYYISIVGDYAFFIKAVIRADKTRDS